jgi:hypothetical protein
MMPIPGGIDMAGMAIAGLKAASSMSEPTRIDDSLRIVHMKNAF